MEKPEKKDKEIAEAYLSSLIDLNVNSKPLINMLTMLAEENIEHGQTIVDAVEQRIAKVEPDFKLPILYLIDSIVKNVGCEYIGLFSHSIVNIFCGVFEKVNEKIRHKMFALRQTWNDVFPPTKLYALDIKVNRIDPGWPITQKVSPAIHVNPNFFQAKSENDLQAELQIKQRELLELKKRKLELELAATQKQLGLTTTTSLPESKPLINPSVLPDQLMKTNNIAPLIQSQTGFGAQTQNHNMGQTVPPTNIRQRIAPVNSALISSVCIRDPRLRTTQQSQSQPHPSQQNQPAKLQLAHFNGPTQRIGSSFPNNNINNNNNRNWMPRISQPDTMPYNDNNKITINSNNSVDSSSKNTRKDGKSSRSSSSHKASSKSSSNSKSNSGGTNSSKSKTSSTRSSSSKGSGGRSSSRGSSRTNTANRSSSSGSKDHKERKDDNKSPQRKKSASRNRSPSSSSSRRSISPKESSKSPRKTSSTYDSKLSPKSSDNSNLLTGKYTKEKKSPIRNSRERSRSPLNPTTITTKSQDIPTKDIDLRSQLPHSIGLNASPRLSSVTIDKDLTTVTSTTIAQPTVILEPTLIDDLTADDVNTTNSSEQKFNDAASKDIDLRVGILPTIVNVTSPSDIKKRISDEQSSEEPKSKKSKSEKIDLLFGSEDGNNQLFGTEDVDLRTLTQGITTLNPLTPPPPPIISTAVTSTIESDGWAKMKGDTPKKSPSKSPLDAVRAKLAEATKTNSLNSKSRNRDIDLRQRIDLIDETSQETDAKLKLIMAQAQEQVENENMNKDQIQSLVQQMIKIKNDTEARKSYKRNNFKAKKSHGSDENEAFSSDSGDENLKQSHRVPSKRRRGTPPKRHPNETSSSSIITTNTGITSSTDTTSTTAPVKERRPRKTKWSSPWEDAAKPITVPLPPLPPASIMPSQFPMPLQMQSNTAIWQQNPIPFNGPMGMMMPPQQSNLLSNSQIIMAQHGSSKATFGAKERTINIDNIPREIRFYEENAIAFMKENGGEPKEIGFQSGERRLCVNNKESILLAFNDTYKPFVIDGKQYQIRFGSPTRELYIDNEWYECYFGDPPVSIALDNKWHVFKIDGPAPQVRIGNLRTDLVVGKVDMYVDITVKITLFLDAQVQMFQVNNQMHTIQFADYFLTVLIDNIPFSVQYGAMPTKFQLHTGEHYIRFSVLPNDVVPGKVFIRNMVRTNLHRDLVSPPPIIVADVVPQPSTHTLPPVSGPILPLMSIVPNHDIIGSQSTSTSIPSSENQSNAVASESNNLSCVSNPTSSLSSLNINDLFQKLLASGILPKTGETKPAATATTTPAAAVTVIKEKEKEKQTPVLLSKPETLKKRQSAIVHSLFSGMQCSSCGVRFPPEQTMKYSQHLDWHYRQNRRERDSARRAHSRKWYYDVSDWIQYEEIENLEEREKNWFETQQTEMDTNNDESNQRTNSPLPSCIAESDDHNKTCEVCHDQFETFYNEETEEWHLRNAIRVDGSTYHPVCYEDYKASLTLDLNVTNIGDITTDDNAVDILIKKEKRELNDTTEERISLDDDDDVIVVPQDEPIITEIPDDDEDDDVPATKLSEIDSGLANSEAPTSSNVNPDETTKTDEDIDNSMNNESDVQILEPQISVMDLDEIEDRPENDVSSTTLDDSQQFPVKIKSEPKYEGYADDDEDDGFEDVGTFEGEPISVVMNDETSVDEYIPQPVHSQQTLITTMDGNVQLQDAQPTTIGTNKIKINITKNVQLNRNTINSGENIDNNLAINSNDKVLGGGGGVANVASATNSKSQPDQIGDTGNGVDSAANVDIEYDLKDSMKRVTFKQQPVVHSGLETSGLCSIM